MSERSALPLAAWLALACALACALAWPSLDDPLTLDQADPVAVNARALAAGGFAALGRGDYELSHTTPHLHLLGWSYALLGESPRSARLLSLACLLVQLLLLACVCRQLGLSDAAAGWVLLLYAGNPFVLRYGLLVDQEPTLSPIGWLLFAWWAAASRLEPSPRWVLIGGLALAAAVWAKPYSPWFAWLGAAVVMIARHRRRGALGALGVALIGAGAFVVSWVGYCWLTGIDPLCFYRFSVANKALSGSFHTRRHPVAGLRMLAAFTARLLTPCFLALVAAAAVARWRQGLADASEAAPARDAAWLYLLALWPLTILHMYAFPRYQAPLIAAAALLAGWQLARETRPRERWLAAAVGLAIGLPLGLLTPDPLLAPAQISPLAYVGLLIALPLAAGAAALRAAGSRSLWAVLLCGAVAQAAALHAQQRGADYTTAVSWDEYGERGLAETIAYLARHADGELLTRKDIGHALTAGREQPWRYNAALRHLKQPAAREAARDLLRDPAITIVTLDRYVHRRRAQRLLQATGWTRVKTFGEFEIYRREAGR